MNTPAINTSGLAAHTMRSAANYPVVQGRCPACNLRTLFLASGGFVTCSSLYCTNPCAAGELLRDRGPT
jgi:hypothetical protein